MFTWFNSKLRRLFLKVLNLVVETHNLSPVIICNKDGRVNLKRSSKDIKLTVSKQFLILS